jgi:hypothetical protein
MDLVNVLQALAGGNPAVTVSSMGMCRVIDTEARK